MRGVQYHMKVQLVGALSLQTKGIMSEFLLTQRNRFKTVQFITY